MGFFYSSDFLQIRWIKYYAASSLAVPFPVGFYIKAAVFGLINCSEQLFVKTKNFFPRKRNYFLPVSQRLRSSVEDDDVNIYMQRCNKPPIYS